MSTAHSAYLETMLQQRGLDTPEKQQAFLEPSYDTHLHDPWLLPDITKAVERIVTAIDQKEQIVIYSDYDADGIPGGVIWHDFLTAIGYTNFRNYIPHRHYEGFGLRSEAVKTLAKEGAQLIITVDCGTTDTTAVSTASTYEIDVIITDHHEPPSSLPDAHAIVNPKIGTSYPFPDLCGAAVAYKVIQALLSTKKFAVTEGQEKWWLDMVGLATIADMVPLLDENRVLATYGLMVLRKSRRPGLQRLLKKQQASQTHLSEDDIGFTIGPRINAASRMDTPEEAFFMLATADEAQAAEHVATLEALNKKRKTTVASMTRTANDRLQSYTEIPTVLVLGDVGWRPSLVGLVANALAEKHNCPAFVWGQDGNGVLKGSCRTGNAMSVVRLMEATTDQFIEFGGHHASGGFSITDSAIHTLPQALLDASQEISVGGKTAQTVDYTFTVSELTHTIWREQSRLAPFGLGNPKPIYKITDVPVEQVTLFGKSKEHTKLIFSGSPLVREAIAFFTLPETFTRLPEPNTTYELLAHLEQSFFMGRLQTRLRIIDVL